MTINLFVIWLLAEDVGFCICGFEGEEGTRSLLTINIERNIFGHITGIGIDLFFIRISNLWS